MGLCTNSDIFIGQKASCCPVDPEHTENQLFYALDLNFDLLPLVVTEYQ